MKLRRQALLLSSSVHYGFTKQLEHAKSYICDFLQRNNVQELLFIPYAQTDYVKFTDKIRGVMDPWGFKITSIHNQESPISAVNSAKAVFLGGGNAFLLLKGLYDNRILKLIRKRVHDEGLLYMSYSSGTIVASVAINNTNDMPIIYPPSLEAVGVVPFNINPHYIDKIKADTYKGKTQYHKIKEYLKMPNAVPVVGLKEGGAIHVDGNSFYLKGFEGAVVFEKDGIKTEFFVGSDLSVIFRDTAKDQTERKEEKSLI